VREATQRLALAGVRSARDRHARAAADRGQELDDADGLVLDAEREALGREGRRQLVEADALGDLVGRAAVDRVDAHERREALGATRRPHGAADAVAVDQLAAAPLRSRDVDVVVGGGATLAEAQEAGAVLGQLDDALDRALDVVAGLAAALAVAL